MSVRPHPQQGTDPRYSDCWLVDFYSDQGKRHKIQFRGTELQARQVEQSLRIRTRRTPVGPAPSLLEAAPLFVAHYTLDHLPAGVERLHRSLKILLRLIGRYQFRSITPQLVEDYKRRRLEEGVKPTTINKELAALSSLCKWAQEQGWCERIQVKRFPLKLARAPIPTVPGRNQVVRFLRALPRRRRGLWAAMYYLGLRVSEARSLRPEAVNWSLGVVIITGKGNKQRIVPMSRRARPYLRHLPFVGARDLRAAAKWASHRAGLDLHITPHSMRHAFGVHLTTQGVPLRALQDLMGHSSSQVTEIYSRLAAETLAREMRKF